MKELLKLQNIGLKLSDLTIFEGITASVQQGDIIGIIGKNGAGKSTLLQLINKEIVPTEGNIQWFQQNLNIVFVEQEAESYTFDELTPFEATLLKRWHVPALDFSKLSGGEKLKARLANGFSKGAHLLLLDEPTNHLDEKSIDFLSEQIKNDKETILFVSHDRYFLDAVATKIWSIEDKHLIEHKGNYSSYIAFREHKRHTQQHHYEKQQKMVERIEKQMNELTSWSKKAHAQSTKKEGFKEYYRVKAKRMDAQVKSKQKRLEQELERAKAAPVKFEENVQFCFKDNNKLGKRFLEVKNLTKAFESKALFQNINFTIQHGEKVSIIGPNGCGKTTLLKVIVGQETAEGELWISPSANIGYLTQEVFDLPLEQTPDQLFYQETFKARGKVQTLLRHLGFTASQWNVPIQNMSMGERVKCKLMQYLLQEKDVLILDEPTNHLDLPSREQLETALTQFKGTLLIVSHDRYFLEKTTSIKLVFSSHNIQKQFKEAIQKKDNVEELRFILETERQEVLGKLCLLTSKDKRYPALDQKYKELTKQISKLSEEC